MTQRASLTWIACSTALLMLAVGVQLWVPEATLADSSMARGIKLGDALPRSLAEGNVRDQPIAATAEMKKAVSELLNYDDAIFRIYEFDDKRVSLYIAWWRPGRMSPRLVAGHTPDVCWPGSGWARDLVAEEMHKGIHAELLSSGFLQGEARVFVAKDKPEYVVFWHKVGGEIVSYRNGWAPPWWAAFDEIWRDGLNLRKEQLFVRVSSDMPLELVWRQAQFRVLRDALCELGLGVKAKPAL